jgi:hypothetical protein
VVAVDEKGFYDSGCEGRLQEFVHKTQEVRSAFVA